MAEDRLLEEIKRHAVLQRAISSRKMDLYGMRQEDGEPVRKFYARIQNLARQCQLTVPCPADGCRYHMAPFVSYADEVVKQVILVGLADAKIKKDVLGTSGHLPSALSIYHIVDFMSCLLPAVFSMIRPRLSLPYCEMIHVR